MWISAEFKIHLIKKFQRLKEKKYKQLGWGIRRKWIVAVTETDRTSLSVIIPRLEIVTSPPFFSVISV
jgi:hypothetical protein